MFKMSDKANRFVGLVFWLLVVIWVWLINQSDFSRYGEFNFDNDGTLAGKFFINIFAGTGYDAAAWLVSLIIAVWLSWRFRHIPMNVLQRIFNKHI